MPKLSPSGLETIPYGCESWSDIVRRNNAIIDGIIGYVNTLQDVSGDAVSDRNLLKWNASISKFVPDYVRNIFTTMETNVIFDDVTGGSNGTSVYVSYSSLYYYAGQRDYVLTNALRISKINFKIQNTVGTHIGRSYKCEIRQTSGADLGSVVATGYLTFETEPSSEEVITFTFDGDEIAAGTYHIAVSPVTYQASTYLRLRTRLGLSVSGNSCSWRDTGVYYTQSATQEMWMQIYEYVNTNPMWMLEEFGNGYYTYYTMGATSAYYYVGLKWQPSDEFYLRRLSAYLYLIDQSYSASLYGQLWSLSGGNLDVLLAETTPININTLTEGEYVWADLDFGYPLVRVRDDREYAFVITFKSLPGSYIRFQQRHPELGTSQGRTIRAPVSGVVTVSTVYDSAMKVWSDETFTTTSTSTTTTTTTTTTTA